MSIPDRRTRAGRGAARRVSRVHGMAGGGFAAARGELDGVGLAEDDRAGMPRHGNARRIPPHLEPRVDRGVLGGGHVGGVDHVLDAEGQAVEPAAGGVLSSSRATRTT